MSVASNSSPQNSFLAYSLGILGVLIFGATLPATTLALTSFEPWFLTIARAMLASIGALLWLGYTKNSIRTNQDTQLFLIGLLLIYGFPGFMALALQTVPASHGGVVLGFLPMATAIIARIIADEQPSPLFWIVGIAGAVIVATFAYLNSSNGEEPGFSIGDFWLLLAGVCAALGYVLSGKTAKTMPGYEVICRALLWNSPITIILMFWLWRPDYSSPTPIALAALLYLGFFSMFIGFFAWNTALAMGGIAKIGQLQLLQIFVTILVSAIILGETIGLATIVTATIVTILIGFSRKL